MGVIRMIAAVVVGYLVFAVASMTLLGPVMELILEGLHQSAILAKEEVDGLVTYLDMFQTMFSNLEERR